MNSEFNNTLSWEYLCSKFKSECKNKDVHILVIKMKDYMLLLHSTINEKEFNDIKFTLCHRNNITFDVSNTIINYFKYCFGIEIKELSPKLKTIWKIYRQESNRKLLFEYIDREIEAYSKNNNKNVTKNTTEDAIKSNDNFKTTKPTKPTKSNSINSGNLIKIEA